MKGGERGEGCRGGRGMMKEDRDRKTGKKTLGPIGGIKVAGKIGGLC